MLNNLVLWNLRASISNEEVFSGVLLFAGVCLPASAQQATGPDVGNVFSLDPLTQVLSQNNRLF